MIIHLRVGIAPDLKQPTRGSWAGHPFHPPIRSCSGWGFPSCSGHPEYWWALTPPFHPYPLPSSEFGIRSKTPEDFTRHSLPVTPALIGAVSFLWHFPSRRRDWALPSILPCGARTFLPPDRASDHLIHFHAFT